MKLVLAAEAKLELRHAALYYEDCREGLGEEFLDAVESAFDQISVWRDLCCRRADDIRGGGDASQA